MPTTVIVRIPAGEALSQPLDLSNKQQLTPPLVLVMPAEWTPAIMTFMVSIDGGVSYYDLHDPKAAEVMFNVQPNAAYWINRDSVFVPFGWLRFRSGQSARPIVQTAERAFSVVFADRPQQGDSDLPAQR